MYLSKFLLTTNKNITSEAKLKSHQLMLRSGMVKQLSSGIYSWLPLGIKVLQKIKNVIRNELNSIDAQEVLLPSLQSLSFWEKSGRAIENSEMKEQMFFLKDHKKNRYVLPPSGEEVITKLFSDSIQSYKDLGKILYQISWKFRDEIRPRHGVMRAKELLMKDAYSFDLSEELALQNYERVFRAYLNIFKAINLDIIPVLAPTGAMGGNYSHEFHVLAQNGESKIYYQEDLLRYLKQDNFTLKGFENFYAKEEEKHNLNKTKILKITQSKSIEVGHMFYLGQKYSKSFNCTYQTSDGIVHFAEMCCYGIGISRLVAAIIENSHDNNGIIWPDTVAPFQFGIINLRPHSHECITFSINLYNSLNSSYEVLLDDTNKSSGKKFADMDLIGIPWQIIVGSKYTDENKVELKNRKTGKILLLKREEIYEVAKKILTV